MNPRDGLGLEVRQDLYPGLMKKGDAPFLSAEMIPKNQDIMYKGKPKVPQAAGSCTGINKVDKFDAMNRISLMMVARPSSLAL